MHRGQNSKYMAMIAVRVRRTNDRALHRVAKSIHEAMQLGTLDAVTRKTFKWIKNRPTAAEREAREETNDNRNRCTATRARMIIVRDKIADKGRVRRLKEKVRRILKLPKDIRRTLASARWLT